MKLLISMIAIIVGVAQATSAYAANYQGTVESVYAYNGLVFIHIYNGVFDGPGSSCSPNSSSIVFSIDPNTAFGRTLVSIAITAKTTGLLVYAAGNGACGVNPFNGGGSEGLLGIDLKG